MLHFAPGRPVAIRGIYAPFILFIPALMDHVHMGGLLTYNVQSPGFQISDTSVYDFCIFRGHIVILLKKFHDDCVIAECPLYMR